MRKKRIALCCGAFLVSCMLWGSCISVMADNKVDVTESQKVAIRNHCDAIRKSLEDVQKSDARTRVYLGRNYELILTKYITPLNVRLLESNLSNAELVENQNNFAKQRDVFSQDFISYQQSLEELISVDCKNEPSKFYEKLVSVRKRRKVVEQDVIKMRALLSEQVRLVNDLGNKI